MFCKHKIIKTEKFFNLELEIYNKNINDSIKELIEYKNMNNENLIYCSKYKKS